MRERKREERESESESGRERVRERRGRKSNLFPLKKLRTSLKIFDDPKSVLNEGLGREKNSRGV